MHFSTVLPERPRELMAVRLSPEQLAASWPVHLHEDFAVLLVQADPSGQAVALWPSALLWALAELAELDSSVARGLVAIAERHRDAPSPRGAA